MLMYEGRRVVPGGWYPGDKGYGAGRWRRNTRWLGGQYKTSRGFLCAERGFHLALDSSYPGKVGTRGHRFQNHNL